MRLKLAIFFLALSSLFPICDAAACGREHRERHGLFQRMRERRESRRLEKYESTEATEASPCKGGKCPIQRSEVKAESDKI
jgi:hypothetical protein